MGSVGRLPICKGVTIKLAFETIIAECYVPPIKPVHIYTVISYYQWETRFICLVENLQVMFILIQSVVSTVKPKNGLGKG